IEIIKAPHFVGAVVRAKSRADAAVVSHHIEPVLAMNGRVDWANRFTWRVLAMLAGHRLEHHLGMLRPVATVLVERLAAGVVTINTEPVHDAAMRDLQFSNNRNVVFRLAGNHASVTAGAHIQVDAHSPLLRRVQWRMGVETRRRMRQFFCTWNLFREIVVFAITLQRSLTNKTAAFDAEMFLCDREW